MGSLQMNGFDRFWTAWPKSDRKGGKSTCLKVWTKNYNESQTELIVTHVEYMKQTDAWRKSDGAFIPAPLVYLNQQRWDGAEIPESFTGVERVKAPDPALVKIQQDWGKAAPIPDHIKKRLAEMRKPV